MTTTSDRIVELASYGATDWAVTASEEREIVRLLRGDSDLSRTIRDVDGAGMLDELFQRLEAERRRAAVEILAGGLNTATAPRVRRPIVGAILHATGEHLVAMAELPFVFDVAHAMQTNLRRLGLSGAAPAFDVTPYQRLISSDQSAPFTGSGATGVPPRMNAPGLWDSLQMAAGDEETRARYNNPIPSDLAAYLSGLSAAERQDQARLVLRREIVTFAPQSYRPGLPSRAQIIRIAAAAHRLHPELIAAFVLAEQRDQSAREDGKDLAGARSVLLKNFSIGLGQVVVSTAKRNNLFADLLHGCAQTVTEHRAVAGLLASDELNLFAVARYIRMVAQDGARHGGASLPNTVATFPGIDLAIYAANSSLWPDANIAALASEYTSRAWDDSLSEGWAWFVLQAYGDVKRAGVF